MRYYFFVTLIVALISCDKGADQPTPPATPDSVALVTVMSRSGPYSSINFKYDDQHRVSEVWGERYPSDDMGRNYVFYDAQSRPSHIIYEGNQIVQFDKSSIIFHYGPNNKCVKTTYKIARSGKEFNDPYFSTPTGTDLEVGRYYDSLTYDSNNRITAIFKLLRPARKGDEIRYYYPSATDSVPNKLEWYTYDTSGTRTLFDQILLTTNNIDFPLTKIYWYGPFLSALTTVAGSPSAVQLPILHDEPTTYFDDYLVYVQKCITNYKIYNNWGSNNRTTSVFRYDYSPGVYLFSSAAGFPPTGWLIEMKKVPK